MCAPILEKESLCARAIPLLSNSKCTSPALNVQAQASATSQAKTRSSGSLVTLSCACKGDPLPAEGRRESGHPARWAADNWRPLTIVVLENSATLHMQGLHSTTERERQTHASNANRGT
eukprot:195696-Amphidinium_carterae.1